MLALADARFLVFDHLDSTNSQAFRLAEAGRHAPLWVRARRQSAGRGRLGRQWCSPQGNLYASLLIFLPAMPIRAFPLSLLAGIALHDALGEIAATFCPDLKDRGLRLKWPNDIIDGPARKLAGILVESRPMGGGREVAVVLGFGVNIAAAPRLEQTTTATCLQALGCHAGVEPIFAALDRHMMRWLARWQQVSFCEGEKHAADFSTAWCARAMALGEEIQVHDRTGRRQRGRFAGLSDDGGLKLRLPGGGERVIAVGDITLL